MPKECEIKVFLICNSGGGFAEHRYIKKGTSVVSFFNDFYENNARPADYHLRVNGLPCPADYILQEGDRVTFTPTKVSAANLIVDGGK